MNPTRAAMRGRQLANRMMVDHCTITRPGRPAVDPLTGRETQIGISVYLGPCRITSELHDEHLEEAGGASFNVERLALQLPHGSAVLRGNEQVEITRSLNPALTGRKFRIIARATKSLAIIDKYTIEELA